MCSTLATFTLAILTSDARAVEHALVEAPRATADGPKVPIGPCHQSTIKLFAFDYYFRGEIINSFRSASTQEDADRF